MFTLQARFIIAAILIILGFVFARYHTYELVGVVVLFMVLLAVDYFRQGTLVLAAKQFHLKNYNKTEALLAEVKNPNWLSKKRRGFYEYMMAGVSIQKHDFEAAEYHYEQAAQYPLRNLNDHIAALVSVANISLRNGKPDKTAAYLELARKHEEKLSARMREKIAEIQQNLNRYKL